MITERPWVAEVEVREQFRVAEQSIQNGLRLWNDTVGMMADTSFTMAEQSLQCSHKVLESYLQFYQRGFNTWRQYLQQINDSVTRPISSNGDGRK